MALKIVRNRPTQNVWIARHFSAFFTRIKLALKRNPFAKIARVIQTK